jgi:hypothetical protein
MPAQEGFYDALQPTRQLADAERTQFKLSNNGTSDFTTETVSRPPVTDGGSAIDYIDNQAVTFSGVTGSFDQLTVLTSTQTPNQGNVFTEHYKFTFPATGGNNVNVTLGPPVSAQFPAGERGAVEMAGTNNYGSQDGEIVLIENVNGTANEFQRETGLSLNAPGVSTYFAPTPTITNTAGKTFSDLNGVAFDIDIGGVNHRVSEGPITDGGFQTTFAFPDGAQLTLSSYEISFT